jgi:hypothetical protein
MKIMRDIKLQPLMQANVLLILYQLLLLWKPALEIHIVLLLNGKHPMIVMVIKFIEVFLLMEIMS